jgi:hypothetical protein
MREEARELFLKSLGNIEEIQFPMSMALTGIALTKYLEKERIDRLIDASIFTAENLTGRFIDNSNEAWKGFDTQYSYCATRPSQAMILLGKELENKRYTKVGIESLDFLMIIYLMMKELFMQ